MFLNRVMSSFVHNLICLNGMRKFKNQLIKKGIISNAKEHQLTYNISNWVYVTRMLTIVHVPWVVSRLLTKYLGLLFPLSGSEGLLLDYWVMFLKIFVSMVCLCVVKSCKELVNLDRLKLQQLICIFICDIKLIIVYLPRCII